MEKYKGRGNWRDFKPKALVIILNKIVLSLLQFVFIKFKKLSSAEINNIKLFILRVNN